MSTRRFQKYTDNTLNEDDVNQILGIQKQNDSFTSSSGIPPRQRNSSLNNDVTLSIDDHFLTQSIFSDPTLQPSDLIQMNLHPKHPTRRNNNEDMTLHQDDSIFLSKRISATTAAVPESVPKRRVLAPINEPRAKPLIQHKPVVGNSSTSRTRGQVLQPLNLDDDATLAIPSLLDFASERTITTSTWLSSDVTLAAPNLLDFSEHTETTQRGIRSADYTLAAPNLMEFCDQTTFRDPTLAAPSLMDFSSFDDETFQGRKNKGPVKSARQQYGSYGEKDQTMMIPNLKDFADPTTVEAKPPRRVIPAINREESPPLIKAAEKKRPKESWMRPSLE